MKKLSFFIALFALLSTLFISCSKEDGASGNATYYIKGKKDGVAFNFTTNSMAKVTSTSGIYLFNLIASGTGMEGFNIGINIYNGGTLQTGTYLEDNAGTDYTLGGVYNPNSTTMVYAAGIQSSANPLVVNILTKTSTEVTGTFSGAFYRQSTTGTFYPDFITITEGEFKLKIQ